MGNMAQKIGQLKKEDYDRKVFSLDEIGKNINAETARNLKLCEKFNLKGGDILASELIHSKNELALLKKEKPSFREQGKNDEKIAELTELVSELEILLREKGNHASRLQSHRAKEDAHSEAVSVLEPLADKLKEIEKELKDNFADIGVLRGSTLGNPINPDTFRLMEAMARPSGVFN